MVPQFGTSVTEGDIVPFCWWTPHKVCVLCLIGLWPNRLLGCSCIDSFASKFPWLWLHSLCDRPNELVKIRIDKAPITANSLYRHGARLCCGLWKCNLVKWRVLWRNWGSWTFMKLHRVVYCLLTHWRERKKKRSQRFCTSCMDPNRQIGCEDRHTAVSWLWLCECSTETQSDDRSVLILHRGPRSLAVRFKH